MKKKVVLFVGPYPEGQFQHIGGATILFKNLVDYFATQDVAFDLISIKKYQGMGSDFLNYFDVIVRSVYKIPKCHTLFLNFNRRGLLYLSPLLFIYAKLFRVRIVLRMFGENSIEIIESVSFPLKGMLIFIFRKASLLFFETKLQVEYFKSYNSQTFWFPNCRKYPIRFIKRTYNKKYVFISQIKVNKGILLILDVFRKLDSTYSLEVYGPILDAELLFIKDLDCYKGIITFDDVFNVLHKNDVLLLPTFHPGEGYPGIIIEAYSMSVPVISTKWKSIPEIVIDGKSGILIEHNSEEALKMAILKVDDDLHEALNWGSFEMSKEFQSDEVHSVVMEIIQNKIES